MRDGGRTLSVNHGCSNPQFDESLTSCAAPTSQVARRTESLTSRASLTSDVARIAVVGRRADHDSKGLGGRSLELRRLEAPSIRVTARQPANQALSSRRQHFSICLMGGGLLSRS